MNEEFDVVVLGEPMVERHRTADGTPTAADSVSGDAFNAACAAALAGARVAMLTVLGTDRAGDLVLDELAERGVDPSLVRRAEEPTGSYTVTPDEQGQPRFSYQRAGSAASGLAPALLEHWGPVLDTTPVLVTSGITSSLSPTAAALVEAAVARVASAGGAACYDVNFRANLTTPGLARRTLLAVAPACRLLKLASPGDSEPLLGVTGPAAVCAALAQLSGAAVAVTRGSRPLLITDGGVTTEHPTIALPTPVDSTGAGDTLLGTLAAALARGGDLAAAAPLAVVAAGLSTQHRGGAPRATVAEVHAAWAATQRTGQERPQALKEEARP
ncbi:MAG TPA: PfkB family carbohydrate kinase [Pseudonocardia sp.]|jgi:sugar/nucleoside kinase (ribokinase family)|nr:PfkB family carbohydrate kinase [Pseudonocardia sp.]